MSVIVSSFLLPLLPSPIVANTLLKASRKLMLFLGPHVILFFHSDCTEDLFNPAFFELNNMLFNVLIYFKSELCLIFVTPHDHELEYGSC